MLFHFLGQKNQWWVKNSIIEIILYKGKNAEFFALQRKVKTFKIKTYPHLKQKFRKLVLIHSFPV